MDSILEITTTEPSVVEVDENVIEVVIDERPVDVVMVDDSPDLVVDRVQVEVVDVARQGPQGIPGVGSGNYHHMQNAVASTWIVNHNLGYRPNVTAFNSADTQVEGDTVHVSVNQFIITFTSAFSGYALVS